MGLPPLLGGTAAGTASGLHPLKQRGRPELALQLCRGYLLAHVPAVVLADAEQIALLFLEPAEPGGHLLVHVLLEFLDFIQQAVVIFRAREAGHLLGRLEPVDLAVLHGAQREELDLLHGQLSHVAVSEPRQRQLRPLAVLDHPVREHLMDELEGHGQWDHHLAVGVILLPRHEKEIDKLAFWALLAIFVALKDYGNHEVHDHQLDEQDVGHPVEHREDVPAPHRLHAAVGLLQEALGLQHIVALL
mmetsp:Transcript_45905/g.143808  ORF Transcript_45905/g.143808 Transcript_45905/m.143808 type:complete len:246 (-) Transcript_45905:135-872(-)